MPRRRKRTEEEKAEFAEYLRELRRRKGLPEDEPIRKQKPAAEPLDEPADKLPGPPPADGSLFSEEKEIYSPLPPSNQAGKQLCQKCFQWKGTENYGPTHPGVCWHCHRNPPQPPRANVMVLPPARPEGW